MPRIRPRRLREARVRQGVNGVPRAFGRLPHERAVPLTQGEIPFLFEQGERVFRGDETDAVTVGEHALGRQAGPRRIVARGDLSFDLFGNGEIFRSLFHLV